MLGSVFGSNAEEEQPEVEDNVVDDLRRLARDRKEGKTKKTKK